MSIKKEANGRRSVQVEVEVPGTPEQVWQAIATGPGVSAWFVPTEVDCGVSQCCRESTHAVTRRSARSGCGVCHRVPRRRESMGYSELLSLRRHGSGRRGARPVRLDCVDDESLPGVNPEGPHLPELCTPCGAELQPPQPRVQNSRGHALRGAGRAGGVHILRPGAG